MKRKRGCGSCSWYSFPKGYKNKYKSMCIKNEQDRSPAHFACVKGFEPSTFWSVARRSIQLSYTHSLLPVIQQQKIFYRTRQFLSIGMITFPANFFNQDLEFEHNPLLDRISIMNGLMRSLASFVNLASFSSRKSSFCNLSAAPSRASGASLRIGLRLFIIVTTPSLNDRQIQDLPCSSC